MFSFSSFTLIKGYISDQVWNCMIWRSNYLLLYLERTQIFTIFSGEHNLRELKSQVRKTVDATAALSIQVRHWPDAEFNGWSASMLPEWTSSCPCKPALGVASLAPCDSLVESWEVEASHALVTFCFPLPFEACCLPWARPNRISLLSCRQTPSKRYSCFYYS